MHSRTHALTASYEQTARIHDLAKVHALQLRHAAVAQFWGAAFALVSGVLARRPRAARASRGPQGV
jgi:hypothetical protein